MRIAFISSLVVAQTAFFGAGISLGQVTVELKNTLAEPREDEVVAVGLSELRRKLDVTDPNLLSVTDPAAGTDVISQVWDDDGDGEPDQLLFLVSLWANETRRYAIGLGDGVRAWPGRTYAAYIPERDDVAWESDRIAFRAYGQGLWTNPDYDPLHSSGIDVWVKRTRDLVIDRWYGAGHDAYHVDRGEGADFFTVGPTLGAGGSAVWIDHTLFPAENFKDHRIIAQGPIRATFEVTYDPWEAGQLRVRQTRRITIDAGQNLYREELVFRTDSGDPVPFVVGFVKRKEGVVGSTKRGASWSWLSTWGPVERKNGGHGELGSAVILPTDRLNGFEETDDHYLAVSSAESAQAVTQYVGSGWTASRDFETVEDWWECLDRFVRRLQAPLRPTIVE